MKTPLALSIAGALGAMFGLMAAHEKPQATTSVDNQAEAIRLCAEQNLRPNILTISNAGAGEERLNTQ